MLAVLLLLLFIIPDATAITKGLIAPSNTSSWVLALGDTANDQIFVNTSFFPPIEPKCVIVPEVDEYTPCTARPCSTGTQQREVYCKSCHLDDLVDAMCSSTKPGPIVLACDSYTYSWIESFSQPCQQTSCGLGTRRFLVQCQRCDGAIVEDEKCSMNTKPVLFEPITPPPPPRKKNFVVEAHAIEPGHVHEYHARTTIHSVGEHGDSQLQGENFEYTLSDCLRHADPFSITRYWIEGVREVPIKVPNNQLPGTIWLAQNFHGAVLDVHMPNTWPEETTQSILLQLSRMTPAHNTIHSAPTPTGYATKFYKDPVMGEAQWYEGRVDGRTGVIDEQRHLKHVMVAEKQVSLETRIVHTDQSKPVPRSDCVTGWPPIIDLSVNDSIVALGPSLFLSLPAHDTVTVTVHAVRSAGAPIVLRTYTGSVHHVNTHFFATLSVSVGSSVGLTALRLHVSNGNASCTASESRIRVGTALQQRRPKNYQRLTFEDLKRTAHAPKEDLQFSFNTKSEEVAYSYLMSEFRVLDCGQARQLALRDEQKRLLERIPHAPRWMANVMTIEEAIGLCEVSYNRKALSDGIITMGFDKITSPAFPFPKRHIPTNFVQRHTEEYMTILRDSENHRLAVSYRGTADLGGVATDLLVLNLTVVTVGTCVGLALVGVLIGGGIAAYRYKLAQRKKVQQQATSTDHASDGSSHAAFGGAVAERRGSFHGGVAVQYCEQNPVEGAASNIVLENPLRPSVEEPDGAANNCAAASPSSRAAVTTAPALRRRAGTPTSSRQLHQLQSVPILF